MQVTETLSEGLKRAFTVVLPAADLEGKRAARFAELGKTLHLPGFRPGKVPLPVVRQRYGKAVAAEVLEESVGEATRRVLDERGLRPATQPKIDLVAPEKDNDLEFKMEFEVLPDFPLPDLGTIRLTRLTATASVEAVDEALSDIARRNRTSEDLDEVRPAQTGEVLRIVFSGTRDGKVIVGGSATELDVEVGGEGFIPGFAERLEGMAPGETRQFALTFPPDYPNPELAGKEVGFEVTARKLCRPVVPALDDELATRIGYDSFAELRDSVAGRLQREYDAMSRMRLKRQLLDELAKRVDFTVPQALVDAEFDQIWRRVEADRAAGQLDEEDRGKDEMTLRADYRAIAERRVRLGLLLAEIGRANNVSVGADEMTRAMRLEAMRYPRREKQVMDFLRKNPAAAEHLRGPLFEDKVIDFLLGQVQVEVAEVGPKELAREPEIEIAPGAGSAIPSTGPSPRMETATPPPEGADQAATAAPPSAPDASAGPAQPEASAQPGNPAGAEAAEASPAEPQSGGPLDVAAP